MGMVAADRRIASAFFVSWGQYGDVSRFAQQHGVSRQWVYREAKQVALCLEAAQSQQAIQRLQSENASLREQLEQLTQRLARAVVLDEEKQTQLACVGQSCGVTLSQCHALLQVLMPHSGKKPLSVASLGRRTQAAGAKSAALLAVLDELTRPLVRDVAADEIYVSAAVLMVVEQESLCWLSGHLSAEVSGAAWSEEFGHLPNLEQAACDAGLALAKGLALQNAQRQEQQRPLIVYQGDHFHALWTGGAGLRKAQARAKKALAEAEQAQKAVAEVARQGQAQTRLAARAYHAWQRAEKAMDDWQVTDRLWQQTKEALPLITPEGELNTRAKAQAILAQTLPQLPDSDFAKTKRQLQRPEMLHYLDRVQEQLQALPVSAALREAAVQQEVLRRRPDLLKGENPKAAALRGVLLMCAVVLGKAGEAGQQTVLQVREIMRRAYRASSLVECINSVLRMQQAQHRKMTQGLLDLKRLYWNCHTFRTGRRRGSTPYQRLGVLWPDGLHWWDMLKLTPEQLRDKLSTANKAA
jgi:hypothetical protein